MTPRSTRNLRSEQKISDSRRARVCAPDVVHDSRCRKRQYLRVRDGITESLVFKVLRKKSSHGKRERWWGFCLLFALWQEKECAEVVCSYFVRNQLPQSLFLKVRLLWNVEVKCRSIMKSTLRVTFPLNKTLQSIFSCNGTAVGS